MFTGIVELLGRVAAWTSSPDGGRRLLVAGAGDQAWQLGVGESVAVNGVCLTVVDREADRLAFDLAEETQRVTTLGELSPGDPVNLERPLRLDDAQDRVEHRRMVWSAVFQRSQDPSSPRRAMHDA